MTWHRHRSQNAETLGDTTPNKNLSSTDDVAPTSLTKRWNARWHYTKQESQFQLNFGAMTSDRDQDRAKPSQEPSLIFGHRKNQEKIKKKSRMKKSRKNQEKIKKKSRKNQEKIKNAQSPTFAHLDQIRQKIKKKSSFESTRSTEKSRKNQVSSRPDRLKNQEKIKFRVDQICRKIKNWKSTPGAPSDIAA